MGALFAPPAPPVAPPPPMPHGDPVACAAWRQAHGNPTVDDIWLLREIEQNVRNVYRRRTWETLFRVLGPRPQDGGGK